MTPTPKTDAPYPLQYFSLVNIPEEVHAAALTLQYYFEQQGQREWRFCALADRRLVGKLERERDEARAEAAKWKANHDNQVALKSAIIQRPDLRDRSERVQSLIRDRDAIKAEIESMRDDINLALIMIEKMKTTIRK